MDYEERFTLHMENHGSFLHIYIPGKVPGDLSTQTIRWTAMAPAPKNETWQGEKQRFKNTLKKKGLLNNLPQKEIPGYGCNYSYDVQFAIPYEICPNTKNMVYVRNDVAHISKHMLWFPLMRALEENKASFDHILIDVPVFPKIVTEDFYQHWYESNQKAISFIQRIQDSSVQTYIQRIEMEDATLLKIKNHMFEGQPTLRLRIDPRASLHQASPMSPEATADLKKRIFARDAYLLRGLDDRPRKCLARGQDIPLVKDYKLHWKTWLSLDGTRLKDNAILVPNDVALAYRTSVQIPTEQYLERHRASLAQSGKPVYIDIPVPMAHYRSKPITRRCTKRQDRRMLNWMTRQAAFEHTYDE